ncbi:MAG: SpoIIE family protein phosphatase, partial [Bacteroidota bacterium]
QTQKDEIQLKKDQIEEIHLELKDSIKYAQRIQSAMLPDDRISNEIMPEHFVLFKPRDIVSGDFYWMTAAKDRLIVAAADCTGHGVPGAFMSMLGISFLNEIVNKEYISDTGNILSNLRSRIIQSLKQKGEFGEQKDGMDIAMFSIDMDGLTASFSGANNPLYLIREGSPVDIGIAEDSLKLVEERNKTLYEVAPDKMPIAIYEKMNHFKVQQIRLQKGDILYVFSDGFADQFGGPNGKKFKYKPFKQLLLNISDNSMSEQRGLLDSAIETWKAHIDETTGKKFEQVDDIVIVGVRI